MMTDPQPDHMGIALAAVAILEGALTHSDEETAALLPTTLPEAHIMISASTFIAYELANTLADYLNGDLDVEEHELGTQQWADQYKRRQETRQKLIEIMRQHVASKFQPKEEK